MLAEWLVQLFVNGGVLVVSAFSMWVFYHLLVDEDDPVKLKADREAFEKDWQELCSRL